MLWVLLPIQLFAGTELEPDSVITLEATEVHASRLSAFSAGHTIQMMDEEVINRHHDQGLEVLLAAHTGLYVRNYGPGILATGTLRGGSAGQTALLWNGFQLQNPMHGQADLALFPILFADEVGVQYGGGSALWGSGSMGGAIHLNNTTATEQGFLWKASVSSANTGNNTQQLDLSWGGNRLATRIRIFNRNASNEYLYKHTSLPDRPTLTQEHAAIEQTGLLHESHLNINQRHDLAVRWWFQDNHRNIPPPLMQEYTDALQDDQALRVTAHWRSVLNNHLFMWRAAMFDESIRYYDKNHGESHSASVSITQEAEWSRYHRKNLLTNTGIQMRWIRASADDYLDDRYTEESIALFGSLKWSPARNKLDILFNARQKFTSEQAVPFSPSLGLTYRLTPALFIKANAGRNYRLPNFNDKYWSPGGNPDLKPEKGWSQDLGLYFENNGTLDQRFRLPGFIKTASLTTYHRKVSDWIAWVPGQHASYWSPENVREVQSYGMESRLTALSEIGLLDLTHVVTYDHTVAKNMRATRPGDASVGKQLIYVPRHTLGYNLHAEYESIGFFIDYKLTGRRYTSTDNKNWLDPYHTANASIHWHYSRKDYGISLYLAASNIWNEVYEVMAARPMPLRQFRLGIRIGSANK